MAGTREPYTMSTNVATSPWWVHDIASTMQAQSRQLLEDYAGVPPEQVIECVKTTRQKAWDIAPYPSVGGLSWLNSYLERHPAYDTIFSTLKNGASIVDCGCFFSSDFRFLAFQGVPTNNMYGFDIEPRFFDIAFEFYNDRDRWKGTFITADASKDLDESPLGKLKGKMDIVWCPKFLHLYDRQGQVEMASRLIGLLKPTAGSLFVGSQNGVPQSEEIPLPSAEQKRVCWFANADDIKLMWDEVAARTRTRWNVESRLLDLRTLGLYKDEGSEYSKKIGYNLQWTATLLEPPQEP